MYTAKERYGQDPRVVARSKTTFNYPLKIREPKKVFTCSWSDFFIEEADAWRDEAWEIVRRTPHLTYQILTKRADRIAEQVPWGDGEPWAHVWLGVSVENARHTPRIGDLVRVPAALRFLSVEPLLGPISNLPLAGIGWVILGGESGPRHRPMEAEWVREIRDQCVQAGVPLFFKQWGGPTPKAGGRLLDGREWAEFPAAAGCVPVGTP
jgi:protein gp37